jgi:hypothetical protein
MSIKYKAIIDPQAKLDLKVILIYVTVNDNTKSANQLLEITSNPCRIIYEIEKNMIYINCVIDGRRNIQEILSNRFLR